MRKIPFLIVITSAFVAVAAGIISAGPAGKARKAKAEFVIESYEFTWKVKTCGKASLAIIKTHDSLKIHLRDNNNTLWLTPEAAAELARPLAKVDEYYKKMRRSKKELCETLATKEHTITFRQSPKYGFSVSIRPKKGLMFTSSLSLERTEAKAMVPYLAKAKDMAMFLDRKIDP